MGANEVKAARTKAAVDQRLAERVKAKGGGKPPPKPKPKRKLSERKS